MRTFEEIIKELEEQPCMGGWERDAWPEHDMHYVNKYNARFVISRRGEFMVYLAGCVSHCWAEFSPELIAAISAACTEIAALRKEEA